MNADPVYLQRIEIDEFRAYGNGFSLELPRGPGLTLLVGPNGSGKTALFDAIEWCLTGKVHRLDAMADIGGMSKREYFGRLHPGRKGDFESRVALTFNHAVAQRRQRYSKDGVPLGSAAAPVTDPAALIKAADWPIQIDVGNLPAYLRATHLLTQAADSRWGRGAEPKKRGEYWKDLVSLSGEGLFDRVLKRLQSGSTTRAFNDAIANREEKLSSARQALERWQALLQHKRDLEDSVSYEGAQSRDQVLAGLEASREQLSNEWPHLTAAAPTGTDSPEQLFKLVGELSGEVAADLESARARLIQVQDLPSLWAGLQAGLNGAENTKTQAQAVLDTLSNDIEQASMVVVSNREKLEGRREELRKAEMERDLLARVIGAKERADTARQQMAQLESEITAWSGAIDERERQVASARSRLVAQEETAAQDLRLNREIATLTGLIPRVQQVVAENRGLAELEKVRAAREDRIAELKSKLSHCEERLTEAQLALVRARQSLSHLAEQANRLQDALTFIAAHLSDHDTSCPVCQSQWEEGELKRRAVAAAEAQNGLLASAQQEVNEQASRVEGITQEQLVLADEVSTVEQDLQTLREKADRIRKDFSALRDIPELKGESTDDPLGVLSRRLEDRKGRRAETQWTLAQTPSHDQLSIQVAEAEKAKREADTTRSTINGLLTRLGVQLAQDDSLLAANGDIVVQLASSGDARGRLMVRHADLFREAEDFFQEAQADLNEAEARHTRLLQSRSSANTELEKCSAVLTELRRKLDGYLADWTAAGLSDQPSNDAIAARRQTLHARNELMSRIRLALERAGESMKVWASSSQLKAAENEMAAEMRLVGAQTPEDAESALQQAINHHERQLAEARRCLETARRLGSAARQAADDYTTRVLAPLNELSSAFFDALVVQSPLRVDLKARTARGATQLEEGAVFSGSAEPGRSPVLSAAHMLSEGQMAATQLVQLLSMHIAYPWSSWRALLLDDPLQYNDILSVAAFIDLVRNLIRFEGYQVVISTHDRELADFILRKLDAIEGLAWCRCEYSGNVAQGARPLVYRDQKSREGVYP